MLGFKEKIKRSYNRTSYLISSDRAVSRNPDDFEELNITSLAKISYLHQRPVKNKYSKQKHLFQWEGTHLILVLFLFLSRS